MFRTNYHFEEILKWFDQESYEYLMLLLPSSDPKDSKLDEHIIREQITIDKLTGDKIAYIAYQEKKITERIGPIKTIRLQKDKIRTHTLISDEVCRHYNIPRYNLPALILITKSHECNLYPVSSENDLISYFSPISYVTSFIEDYQRIDKNREQDGFLFDEKSKLYKVHDNLKQDLRYREEFKIPNRVQQIQDFLNNTNSKIFVEQYGDLISRIEELYQICKETNEIAEQINTIPKRILGTEKREIEIDEEKRHILSVYEEKLNRIIFAENGAEILLNSLCSPSHGLIDLLNHVREKTLKVNRKLEELKRKIAEEAFDIFISSKSEDYQKASEVYNFLRENGYKPFLADQELRQIGTDDYGCAIRQIIQKCHYMIVFASNVDYMTTTYVHSEWNQFLDSLNSGLIEGKLFSIISPSITADLLPPGLSTRQFFTFDNYKELLLQYIKK